MTLITIFSFLGIIAAAVSGTLVGMKKQMDLFGLIFLAAATSLGGGVIRDIMIGHFPPVVFIKPIYFLVSTLAALVTCFFYERITKLQNTIMLSDAVGLGVFTAIGANAAVSQDLLNAPFLVVSMGLLTGIGGGILRDLFAKDIPYVFRKEIYAIASILGALSFLFTYDKVPHVLSFYICLLVTFVVRVVAVMYNVNFPVFRTEQPKGLSQKS
ncbi:trimeric intracellular cation channel family protein [Ectobacillus ponti]|uniref:Trimeric intracellular cation channel family protein n=1 Tax=Ectobacillus ponti TaxID=2961894 RepID=A0AA42BNT7_9BACI|nr:trimeric intracellular cation channel family protein [Ectobacillus ponti]MCP8968052.1 trimeric intracellular cation channel family protein [Ectobacillus ponti]